MPGNVIVQFVARLGICIFIPNVLLLLLYFRKKEFQKVIGIAQRIIKNRRQVHGIAKKQNYVKYYLLRFMVKKVLILIEKLTGMH